MHRRLIALLTDFGLEDPYVGIMKAAISNIAGQCELIDLSHQIPPADIQRGAFVLWQAARDFPARSIFLAVVDPGVGTSRKAIFFQSENQVFIGPDNGLFSYLTYQGEYSAWELENPAYQLSLPGSTFHGRDIFAPAAGYAALGKSGEDFGSQLSSIHLLPKPRLQIGKNTVQGEVISCDGFGNLFTSLGRFNKKADGLELASWIDGQTIHIPNTAKIKIMIGEQELLLADTFGSVAEDSCAGVIGSTGLLEIIANRASARSIMGLERGARVDLIWR